jgi:hypothetical protein
MSEDRTAAAALAIEKYVAGLRSELTLLGSSESSEYLYEVRDMLLDTARDDPEHAFAEMERLGEPSKLAATLLAERGLIPEGGIPAASWMRLGTAAVIDILVGAALPVAAVVMLYDGLWRTLFSPFNSNVGPWDRLFAIAYAVALVGFAVWFAWRVWAPWREGGNSTAGMALAQIAVVRMGGARAVSTTADLRAAGITLPRKRGLSTASSVVLAALALSWSVWMVSTGALDPSGEGAVSRLAGTTYEQQNGVSAAASSLYEAATTPDPTFRTWPTMAEDQFDAAALRNALAQRFGGSSGGFEIGDATNVAPGVWTVPVVEIGSNGSRHRAVLTYALRVDWSSAAPPQATFVLTGYR